MSETNNIKESIMKLIGRMFVQEQKPVYKLEECIKSLNDEALNMLYLNYTLIEDDEKLEEKKTRKEKEKYIKANILEAFSNSLVKENKLIKPDFYELGKTKESLLEYNLAGFAYTYKENDEYITIFPEELKKIWDEYYQKNSELGKSKLSVLISIYLLINGVLSFDFIKELTKKYFINIDDKNIEIILQESNLKKQNEKYYTILNTENAEEEFLEIIKIKESLSYKFLEIDEILDYYALLQEMFSSLNKIIKVPSEELNALFISNILMEYETPEEVASALQNMFSFDDKKKAKIIPIIEENIVHFRYWLYNGRTSDEMEYEELLEDMVMKQKPQNNSLEDCLKSLSKEGLEIIKERYQLKSNSDIKTIKNEIIKDIKENVKNYTEEYMFELIECHNQETNLRIDTKEILQGHLFVYKENDEIFTFLPQETNESLEENLLKEKDFAPSNEDIITGYMYMNGVLEKKTLLQLLEENHQIIYSIKELDELIKNSDMIVEKDKYIVGDIIEKDEINLLLEKKNACGKYKPFNIFSDDIEDEFLGELDDFLESVHMQENTAKEIGTTILFLIKYGVYHPEFLNEIIKEEHIPLNTKQKNKLIDIIKQYKDDMSLWIYNGYTQNDLKQNTEKKQKVGRNDPCPCGSGKKYKKCCGQ